MESSLKLLCLSFPIGQPEGLDGVNSTNASYSRCLELVGSHGSRGFARWPDLVPRRGGAPCREHRPRVHVNHRAVEMLLLKPGLSP